MLLKHRMGTVRLHKSSHLQLPPEE